MARLGRTVILFNPRSMRGIGEDVVPPMGLLMAAIHLHEKFNVVIVDQRVERNWKSRLSKLLEKEPVCIGVTALTGRQIHEGLLASEMARRKGCVVVWGGIHASLLPGQTIDNPLIDYVVEGEGEEAFAELVNTLASEGHCNKIRGVWHKENGRPVFGGQRPFVDLNKLPPIPYHLCDLSKYIKPSSYGRSMILFSSRGCPQRCTFCFNHSFNRSHWRAFSADRILDEIKRFKKDYPAINHFEFWDDNFFANPKRAKDIAEGIKRLDLPITWAVLGSHVRDVARMDDDYLACLRDSKLKEVFTGVESGSQRIIDIIQKNFTVEELFFSNRRLGEYGICPTYSFLSGIPGEDDEDIKKTIDVMFRLKRENPNIVLGNVKPVMCYPGTALYEKALELGFIPPQRLADWSNFVWGNYLNLKIPWVSHQRRRFLSCLYYYTVLMSPTYIFIRSKIFTIGATLLRPIAERRVKNFSFRFPIEAYFMQMIQKIVL
ncbi:MAG: radical SAM protein [Candidatus Omnitrophica bacterium]|nr:radical SAM protein [Candidatus Omnitrophota bacterium]